jgi:hypothetical protein
MACRYALGRTVRHHTRKAGFDLDMVAILQIGHCFGSKHCEWDGAATETSALR